MRIYLLFALLSTSFFSFAQEVNSTQSKVDFEIGNMKINTVEGSFSGMEGELFFDPLSLEECFFQVCIDAKSVDTGSDKRDEHLRTEDFFHTEVYPLICFDSEEVRKGEEADFLVIGTLNLRGVERKVEIPFRFENNTFVGTLELSRLDYSVGEDTGTFMVDDELSITITCVLK